MNVSQSVKLAGIFVALIVLYFLVRGLFGGGASDVAPEAAAAENFTVVVDTISPAEWRDQIVVRGRTKAERKVVVRAETSGVIAETPAALGAQVSQGDVLCRLSVDARKAQLAEARAAFAKADLDYDAATKLSEGGYRSETAVATAKAARDQAAAVLERARLELEKTDIKAPFDGAYDERHAEVGAFLSVGDPCATVIKRSPFLVVGAVSERDVAKVHQGDKGRARLATGETIEGVVRFIATSADPATRTFNIELEVPNEDGALRDGVTAEFTIFARETSAHRVPRASLVLNDEGEIGLRSLDKDNIVVFTPVRPIGESPSGFWVSGVAGDIRLIVTGQEYVTAGQKVDAVTASERAGT